MPRLSAVALLVALLALLPLGFVIWVAIQTGWETASALVFRPRVGELLVNTALLVAVHGPAVDRACGDAGLADRAQRSAGRAALGLARGGAAGGARLRAQLCLGQRRPEPARPLRPACWSRSSPIFRSSTCRSPRSCGGSIRPSRMPPPRSASDPGASSSASCCRNCASPLCGGSLLIGLHLLAEYGLFAMIRFDTFTTAIVDQFQSAYNGPAANMLAGVLVVCCLGLLWLEGVAARPRALCARRLRRRAAAGAQRLGGRWRRAC